MTIDLVVHAGTKFALEQWLDARGLGDNLQDTDPTSPTFGEYRYTHKAPGAFIYWRHPSGKLEASTSIQSREIFPGQFSDVRVVDSYFSGFYGILLFIDSIPIEDWVRNNTGVSILEGFDGYGGEGVTIITPDQINSHCDSIGVPRHEILGDNQWSDPRVWWASPVMIGDQREIDGVLYESLIDFNVWSPVQYPGGWQEVDTGPSIEPWVQPTGARDAYTLGAIVTHNRQTWENTGSNANVWKPGVFGWTVV